MDQVTVKKQDSCVLVEIPIGNSFPEIKVFVGSYSSARYKIYGDSSCTKIWKYIHGDLQEYKEIRDSDGQTIHIERYFQAKRPRKPGKYIDVFIWDDKDNNFKRKTYFQRRWGFFFWGKTVPYNGPIL